MAKKDNIPLATLQAWMQNTLLPNGNEQKISQEEFSLNSIVKSSQRLSAQQHLAIYQRSYIARLRDCMSKQFSALEYALGQDLFRAFADEFLQSYPSTNYNLLTLGKKFPKFLNDTRPDKHDSKKEDWPDFMIELAQFEYAINIIFEEKGNEEYQLATESTPENLFKLIPVFYAFNYRYPIRNYYTAFTKKQEPDFPLLKDSFCIMKRHKYKLTLHEVNHSQYIFLQYLIDGLSIKEAKAKIRAVTKSSFNDFENVWSIWKKEWLRLDFFRRE